jgi:hypothetical protein
MFQRNAIRFIFLLVLICAGPYNVKAQQFERTNFEVGVLYDDDVFSGTTPCTLDDYRFFVDWADGADNVIEMLAQISHPPFPTPNNTVIKYRVPRHFYTAPGAYHVLITNVVHCSGQTGSSVTSRFFDLAVNERGKIGGLETDHKQYKAGEEVQLTVFAPANTTAPASGTRVYLKALSGGQSIDPSEPLASYVDIPAGQAQVTTKFRLGHTLNLGLVLDGLEKSAANSFATITLSGVASNSQTVSFRVQP